MDYIPEDISVQVPPKLDSKQLPEEIRSKIRKFSSTVPINSYLQFL